MILLKNKTARTKVINLPHASVCGNACLCEEAEHRSLDLNGKTGEVGIRVTTRRICASVHLLPGVWSDCLPDEAAEVPEIADLLTRRKVEKKSA